MAYYLRLSEVNGFDSPWQLFKRADMGAHEWRTRAAKTDKIAIIAKLRKEHLDQIAYVSMGSARAFRLLNHPIVSTDIEPERPKLCLECVREKRFIEAHWDLVYMIGCPEHSCWATTSCSACGNSLSIFRRGMLSCQCGARLQRLDKPEMPASVRSLLAIIRARVLDLLPFADFGAGLPVVDLHRLTLRTLLRVTELTGRCQMMASGQEHKTAAAQTIVGAAAEVFSRWPFNFHLLLQALAGRSECPRGIREQFAPLYSALFQRSGPENPEALDFIREEFLRFVTHEWKGRRVDPRTLQRVRAKVGRPYVSGFELAKRLGVDPRTVSRHAEKYPQGIQRGPHSTFVVSEECHSAKYQPRRKLIRIRQAASEIGLPVSVLRALRDSGDFEVKHQMPMQVGFCEGDLAAFKSRLFELVPSRPDSSKPEDAVDLGTCMKGSRYSVSEKATLVRLVLHHSLPVLGHKGESVKDLLLSSTALSDVIREDRATVHGPVMSGVKAAETIGCEFEVLRELVKAGIVTGEKTGKQWKVAELSVAEFCDNYVSLAVLASELRTSSRRLIQFCWKENIPMLFAERKTKAAQPFVRALDRSRVVRYAGRL